MRRTISATIVAALLSGLVVHAATAQTDEPQPFTLDCTVTGNVVECAGTLPEGPPSPTTTTPTTSVSSTTTPSTSSTTMASTAPPTTTTTIPTVTSAPPPPTSTPTTDSADFVATFDTPQDFYDRFDVALDGAHPSGFGDSPRSWEGDHDMSCNGPETSRDVQLGTRQGMSQRYFWWCAPGGDPAKGHIMSAFITPGYAILSFSPKQYFTDVRRVCWDQNRTFLGGRKWTQMAVITRADIERERAEVDDWEAAEGLPAGNLNLGFVSTGFLPGNGPTNQVLPTGESVVVQTAGDALFFHKPQNGGMIGQIAGENRTFEGVAERFQTCVIDNGNGTVTMTMRHWDGRLRTATFPASLPDGQVRVIFQDDQYDGPKDDRYDPLQNTWHWDNIVVDVA